MDKAVGTKFKLNIDNIFDLDPYGGDRDLRPVGGQKRYLDDDAEGAFCLSIDTDSTQPAGSGQIVAYGYETICTIESDNGEYLICSGEGNRLFNLTYNEYDAASMPA